MAKPLVRGIRVSTRYATVDDFVERYCEQADLESIYIAAPPLREIDHECAFAFLLSNAQPVLAGTCCVTREPQGIRLHIRRMGPESREVFAALHCEVKRRRSRSAA